MFFILELVPLKSLVYSALYSNKTAGDTLGARGYFFLANEASKQRGVNEVRSLLNQQSN